MVKRYCDRCGKECGDTWYNINITAECENRTFPITTWAAMSYTTSVFEKTKDYCRECTEEFEEFLQKKRGIEHVD